MNATNLLDNMDGTAAISVLGIAGTILSICLLNNTNNINVASLLIIIGILIGFLVFNWPKAKIYMGDSGSMFWDLSQLCGVSNIFGISTLYYLMLLIIG